MVVSGNDAESLNEVEFPNICSTLIDKKVHLGEKINLLKQVKKSENEYDQIVIDWLCSTIEYVSNSDKYISLNASDINELLLLLNSKLKGNEFTTARVVILSPNIFEVLSRLFSLSATIISGDALLNTWHLLLQNESWKENLTIKSNIASLGWYCKFYIDNQNILNTDIVLNVIEKLLECYLSYIKSQYVSRKVFTVFCNQLLVKMMCLCSASLQSGDELLHINSLISRLFSLIICSKEHLINLKMLLKSKSSHETPIKKRKIDDPCVAMETDPVSETKGKPSKDDVYLDLFFNELHSASQEVSGHLLKALPTIYEAMISTARSSESSLTHLEEFCLLIKLSECLELGVDLTSMKIVEEIFDVVIRYDIYQNVEDNATGNTFHKWMENLIQKFVDGCEKSGDDMYKNLMLKVMLKMLNINHLVLQPLLSKIWNICLQCRQDEAPDLRNMKESFLCELLVTYEKLHQLDSLFSNFGVTEIQKDTIMIYPQKFLDGLRKSISNLLTIQINSILDIYLSKLKGSCTNMNEENVETTICRIEHETYILCYMVLMNASVIPGNGYRKPELESLVKKLEMLKVAVDEFVNSAIHCQAKLEDQKNLFHLPALVQHGVNNIYSLLKEFALIDDADENIVSFDASTVQDTTCMTRYLLVALCFDQLNNVTVKNDVIPIIEKIYEDACDDFGNSKEKWNGQIFCISSINFNDALTKLFEENLSTVLACNHMNLTSLGTKLMWNVMLNSHDEKAEDTEDSSYVLQCLPCYNCVYFQIALLSSIQCSLQKSIADLKMEVDVLLKEDANADTIIEVRDKFLCNGSCTPDNVQLSDVEEQCCVVILKGIQKLPLLYFTEHNLCTLFIMVLCVWERFKKSQYVQISDSCLRIIGNILEKYAVSSHTACHLPLGHIFTTNIQYLTENQMADDFKENLISSCISTVRVVLKYVGRDDTVTTDICNKLLSYPTDECVPSIVVIMGKMLDILSKMLKEPTIKSRSEHTAYQIVSTLSESLLKLLNSLSNKTPVTDSFFTIFADLCQITQHAQVRKTESSPLKFLEDKLVDICPVVIKHLNSLLESGTKCGDNKHLRVLDFLYSSSCELTLRLRSVLEKPETDMITLLIQNAESDYMTDACGHLISNIVLRVNQDKLMKVLDNLTEKLVVRLKNPEKKSILIIWHILLTAKWEKEQRIALWDYLPKVMLTCVHMTKLVKGVDELRLLLRLLTSAVNIGKNSLMSQYVNIIYHVFVLLPEKVRDSAYNRFVELFEEMYQLASQLLFHHQSAIFSSFHAYISSVNNVLEILITYSASNVMQRDALQKCCERMGRLYREIGGHKGVVSKYSSFIISRFIRTSLASPLSATNKKLLESGIYCIMDTCTENEFSFLNTTLQKADKEYFKIIKNNYEKHHKFTGKA